ncbi:Uncharacterized protein APZ42_024228 [Daphnia magna]|uniref:Uncharacterized protein n=1 Tax=Daphnia magna TaxID=35525 RepID=A0A164UK40_9CRUS|nr:Uncharacterized protein APZ42_024228 [Daphnia magna]
MALVSSCDLFCAARFVNDVLSVNHHNFLLRSHEQSSFPPAFAVFLRLGFASSYAGFPVHVRC